MVDNLIANGEINPLIIVTPTFYRPSDAVSYTHLDVYKRQMLA